MQQLQAEEESLKARKSEFKDQVDKFERFMNDNEDKRLRAVKRTQEETRAREGLEADIKQKTSQLEALRIQKEQVLQHLSSLTLYRQYLEAVSEASDDFAGVQDILARHATLIEANSYLLKAQETHLTQMDALRSSLSQFTKEKQNEVLVLQSALADRKLRLENCRATANKCEALLGQGYQGVASRYRTLAEIGMAIENIYSRLPSKYAVDSSTPLDKLEAIKIILCDFQDIVDNGNFVSVTTKSSSGASGSGSKDIARQALQRASVGRSLDDGMYEGLSRRRSLRG